MLSAIGNNYRPKLGFKAIENVNYSCRYPQVNNKEELKNTSPVAIGINATLTKEDLKEYKDLTYEGENFLDIEIPTQEEPLHDSFVHISGKEVGFKDLVSGKDIKKVALMQNLLSQIASPKSKLKMRKQDNGEEDYTFYNAGSETNGKEYSELYFNKCDEKSTKYLANEMSVNLKARLSEAYQNGY